MFELQDSELLLRLLQFGPDLTLGGVFGHQHRRRIGKFLAQGVTFDHRILQPAIAIPHIGIFGAEVGATPLGCPQLLLIGEDLVLKEALRILHVDAVRACGALDENRQQGLHHVMRRLGARVAVGNGEQFLVWGST